MSRTEKEAWKDHLFSQECPSCKGDKPPGIIVCTDCWSLMREKTKEALKVADVYSIGRRKWFYRCLAAGWLLPNIEIPIQGDDYERTPVKRRSARDEEEDDFAFVATLPKRIHARRG